MNKATRLRRAATAMVRESNRTFDQHMNQARKECKKYDLMRDHLRNGNVKAARSIWQNNKSWMYLPDVVARVLWPKYYE